MPIEDHSKSLNHIIDSFSDTDKQKIRSWWRNKMITAFSMVGLAGILGLFIGLGIKIGGCLP